MPVNRPKHSQETWNAIKLEYQSGSYTTLKELALKYHIHPNTLRVRIYNESWNQKQSALLYKAEQRIAQGRDDLVSEYLSNTFSRAKKYEKIIDATLAQHGTDQEGNPLVEIEDLDSLTRSELRVHELAKSSLRIPTLSHSDITSKGQSLGESLVSAIAKLRETNTSVNISDEDHAKLMQLEIEPKKSV